MEKRKDISIIIVNYKVKDYISLLLDSVIKATNNLEIEIFIVDNNSGEDTLESLSSFHENISFIINENNKGFGKANNQGIEKATGVYTLLINPDTFLEEESLLELKEYMDQNSNCAAAGFKMLNPDGTFAKESKRSLPDLKSGIFRVLALDVLFPNSKFFGARYLRWIPETETAEVPVISGAGMFWKTDVLKKLNGFDDSFFMYGEDDDLCYRVQELGYNIIYFPKATLIHFKGESERPVSVKNLNKVNKGLIQFFEKHYAEKYSWFSLQVISTVFYLRVILIYLKTLFLGSKTINHEEIESVILIGDYDSEIISNHLNIEKRNVQSISGLSVISDIVKRINVLADGPKKKLMIIIDVNSISYKKVFTIVEELKDQKLNFHYLLKSEKKIIGKSSVIDL